MKFYEKVRFLGGIGMAAEPFFFADISKDWFAIGIFFALSAFLDREKFKKIHTFLCGKEKRHTDGQGRSFTPDPINRSLRCVIVYATLLSLLLFLASEISKLLP